jgi:hypothetical protein
MDTDRFDYGFRPTLFTKGERGFRLEADAIVGEWGGTARRIAYSDIASLRFSQLRQSLQPMIASCVITARDGAKLVLRSASAKSFMGVEDRMGAYRAFAWALLQWAVRANPRVQVLVGQSRWVWLMSVVALVLCGLYAVMAIVALALGYVSSRGLFNLILVVVFGPSLYWVAVGGRPKPVDPRGLPPGVLPSDPIRPLPFS